MRPQPQESLLGTLLALLRHHHHVPGSEAERDWVRAPTGQEVPSSGSTIIEV